MCVCNALSTGATEVMASTAMAVKIFEANNYGCGIIMWVCFLMSMCSVQRGLQKK